MRTTTFRRLQELIKDIALEAYVEGLKQHRRSTPITKSVELAREAYDLLIEEHNTRCPNCGWLQ